VVTSSCFTRDVRPAQDVDGGCVAKMELTPEEKQLVDEEIRANIKSVVAQTIGARDNIWRERVDILIGIMRPAELKMQANDIIDLIKRAFDGLY